MLNQTLCVQAQRAYEAALSSPSADWRSVAELFRAAAAPDLKPARTRKGTVQEIADYNVDRVKLKCRSPRIAVRFSSTSGLSTND